MAERKYRISVMGKTLEHLGSQLYKQRDAAIAELVANSWDAGAAEVHVRVPNKKDYDHDRDEIIVTDSGKGMTADDIEDYYLKIGRNRRQDDEPPPQGRAVMGRKGIGKLAGFGIAKEVELYTWRDNSASRVVMPIEELKRAPGDLAEVELPGEENLPPPSGVGTQSGSRVILRQLRHVTAIDPEALRDSLARRFTRTVRGIMKIYVNDIEVAEPSVELEQRIPTTGMEQDQLPSGDTVKYFYGFSKSILTPKERRGFVVYVHGKTAHAPPFFFDVEATATGQHGTKYVFGAIEADFLDDGSDDESDVISTDRQEIDWETAQASELKKWGQSLARRALRELRELREQKSEDWVLEDPELARRIGELDDSSQARVTNFVRTLGRSRDIDQERILKLASGLLAVFEYRHFHDLLREIDAVSSNPDHLAELLDRMLRWKVLESRALLEVVQGRLDIVDKFHKLIVEDAAETAPEVGMDNIHDLLSAFPWLLNPDWQTFEHEKRISAQVRQWSNEELEEDDYQRVDFLSLSDSDTLVVVEIKRPRRSVTFEEYQRLQGYIHKLRPAWQERGSSRNVIGLLVCTDIGFDEDNLSPNVSWERWADLHGRVRRSYEHYRTLLELDVRTRGFHDREQEVRETRRIVAQGTYRDKASGKPEIGASDVEYDDQV